MMQGIISLTQLAFGLASCVMTFVLGEFNKFIEYRVRVKNFTAKLSLTRVLVL
jgi:hypothetical protein